MKCKTAVPLGALVLAAGAILALSSQGCAPRPTVRPEPERPPKDIRKVIVSPCGEVTQNTQYVGEPIHYKIYYLNKWKQTVDLLITDDLDPGLTDVVPAHGGKYDPGKHIVAWTVKDVAPRQGGFVEFSAKLGKVKSVENQAVIAIASPTEPRRIHEELREHRTNTVHTKVCTDPKLGWIPFDSVSKPGSGPRQYMKDETTLGTLVNFDIPGMYAQQVKTPAGMFHRLSIPGHATTLEIGKPELPIVGQLIEIPHDVDIKLEIVKSRSITLDCYHVYPAQEPVPRQDRRGPGEFRLDKRAYLTNANYPAQPATVTTEDIGVIRGHRVVFVKVNPVQYNPVTKVVTAHSNIEVRINFSKPAQIRRADPRLDSLAFDQLLQGVLLNYKSPARFPQPTRAPRDEEKTGCDYLIITNGDFYNATDANNPVVRLRNWKRQKGYYTRVVDVANIPAGTTGQQRDDIRRYIKNAYEKWDPVPSFVLLVGDSEFVANDRGINHSSHNNTWIGTDNTYATVDGSDYFPDIYIGRLSVDSLAQAEDVIDKILAYEQNPPAAAAFYTDTSLVCLFEDVLPTDGQERSTFRIIEFAEEIRAFLDNNGYNPERIYDQSGNWPAGPQRYENGTAIPVNLTIAGGFPWNGGTADISNAINGGNFIVTYDGHGGRTDWSQPGFTNNNIANLANGASTPVVFSLACQTGWFDNETDHATLGTGPNDECFCEHFLRRANNGAVAIIGATRISWEHNDEMMLGMFEALWPAFQPLPPGVGLPVVQSGPLVRMGQINVFAKAYVANAYNHDFYRQSTFEMYHVFGDPEMPVWTEQPGTLQVDYPKCIGSTGEQEFVVKVTDQASGDPVHMAMVALTRKNQLVQRDQTDPGGFARFMLNSPSAGTIDITITAHNYRPHQGQIEVTSNGADVNRLDPTDGPVGGTVLVGGQNFSGNENVDIYMGAQLVKTAAASAGSFGQVVGPDVDIQVPAGQPLGPTNVHLIGKTSNRCGVDVFHVRGAKQIDLYLYSQWDQSTWTLHPGSNPTWDNPDIRLYDSSNNLIASNNLTVGNQYTIKATIHNATPNPANNATVTFNWANYGLGQPDRVWTRIATDTVNVPGSGTRDAEVSWTPPATGHLCLRVDVYHVEDTNSDNNKGQENTHVGPTSSPAEVEFMIWNPTKYAGAIHFEVRQLISSGEEQRIPIWGSLIKHPDPQVLEPEKRSRAWLILDPDVANVKSGQRATFELTGFVNGEMVGGMNFMIQKK